MWIRTRLAHKRIRELNPRNGVGCYGVLFLDTIIQKGAFRFVLIVISNEYT